VLGLGWLRPYHRRSGMIGFGPAFCWGSPSPGLPPRAWWIGGGFFRDLILHDGAASNHVIPA
jgi:hypothetical protein